MNWDALHVYVTFYLIAQPWGEYLNHAKTKMVVWDKGTKRHANCQSCKAEWLDFQNTQHSCSQLKSILSNRKKATNKGGTLKDSCTHFINIDSNTDRDEEQLRLDLLLEYLKNNMNGNDT